MSEMLAKYSPGTVVTAGILRDLTEEVRQQGMGPVEAYATLEDSLAEHGIARHALKYGSTAISSAGHARIPGLDVAEIVKNNKRTAQQIVRLLHNSGALDAQRLLLSAAIGDTGWSEVNYMLFWSLGITGPDLAEIKARPQGLIAYEKAFYQHLHEQGVDRSILSSRLLPREERRPQYGRLARACAKFILEGDVHYRPISGLVALVDTAASLGSEAERELALRMQIQTYRVAPMRPAAIDEAISEPTLKRDLYTISIYGGKVLVAAAGQGLALLIDDSPAPAYEHVA